jgi:inorganic pyrophosphatase
VALGDPQQAHIDRIEQVRPHRLVEIEHFFETYKLLEKKETDVVGWRDRDRALEVLAADRAAWERERRGTAGPGGAGARDATGTTAGTGGADATGTTGHRS